MSEHTPGPWESDDGAVEYEPGHGPFYEQGASITAGYDHYVVVGGCQDEQGSAIGVLRNADARLMAASPDLLAACEAALNFIDIFDGFVHVESATHKQLKAAIEKAKGESDENK